MRRRYLCTVSIGIVSLLLLAGCSSSSKPQTSSSTSAPASSAALGTSSTGSGQANPSLAPIEVGWANEDTGTYAYPAATDAALAAADYINDDLGGIQGHELKLDTCVVGLDDQSNQQCGDQFANNSKVHLVVVGVALNGGPLYTAVSAANKPMLGAVPISDTDYEAPDMDWYFGGAAAEYEGIGKYAASLNPQNVSIIRNDIGSCVENSKLMTEQLPASTKVTNVAVPVGAADPLPQVISAKVTTANAIMLCFSDCQSIAQALSTLHVSAPVIVNSSCINPQELTSDPSLYQNWVVVNFGTQANVAASNRSSALSLFLTEYAKYGKLAKSGQLPGNEAPEGWGIIMTLAQVLDQMPASSLDDPSAIKAALGAFKGPVVLGPTTISCPGAAPYTAVCGLGTTQYVLKAGVPVPISS